MSWRPKSSRPKPPEPQRWEKQILATLAKVPSFYLDDLLPQSHAARDLDKLERVARDLEAEGRIAIARWTGTPSVMIVHRPRTGIPDPACIPRLSSRR